MVFIVKIGWSCEFKFYGAEDALKFALAAKSTIYGADPEISIIITDEDQEDQEDKKEGEADEL